ncbi:MAG: response regulator transcription factor [Verrucomicrobia bacterium]|nr:response regulator transcription factor [Verrucomicrobiota bacterium]
MNRRVRRLLRECRSPAFWQIIMSIKVSIVEDDTPFREALATVLKGSHGFECLSSHATGEEAIRLIPALQPDVALVDLGLPGLSGIECIWQIKTLVPELAIMVLTKFEDTERIFDSIKAGASGYILKRTAMGEILKAVEELHHGGSPMTPHIARKLLDCFRELPEANEEIKNLTEREQAILRLSREGLRYKEIAAALGITTDTVRTHFRNIYKKLHVHSRAEALAQYFPARQATTDNP